MNTCEFHWHADLATENARLRETRDAAIESIALLLALMEDGPAAEFLDEDKVKAQAAGVINKAKGVTK